MKIEKIGKLIFHSFQSIACHFRSKMKTAHFEGGGGVEGFYILKLDEKNLNMIKCTLF